MKRDARKLDHKTLEEFRLLAVRRVREGEKPSAVVRSLGMNRTSIYRWLKAEGESGQGEPDRIRSYFEHEPVRYAA